MSAEMDDRFNDGYKAAEAHWRKRWYAANADHQEAVTENERLTGLCDELGEQASRERLEVDRLAARLAAVEALAATLDADLAKADPAHFSIGLMRGRLKEMRAALAAPTDTTKETP